MPDLHCHVTNCMSNKDCMCCRNSINVSGKNATDCNDTCCASFEDARYSTQNSISYQSPELHSDVSCSAYNCVHNQGGGCFAEFIQMSGYNASNMKQTLCSSFKEK